MASRAYEEFIAALNAHGVRYLVIGAHAVAFHARPRATNDLDILLDPTPANARKALAALRDFFDLLSEVPGFPTFSAAWRNRVDARFGSVPAHYLGLGDLLRAKEAAGRVQDRADVRVLRRARSRTKPTKGSRR